MRLFLIFASVLFSCTACAQISDSSNALTIKAGIPITDLMPKIGKSLKRDYVISSESSDATILTDIPAEQITYAQLLQILRAAGHTAINTENLINIVPLARAREMSVPLAEEGSTYPAAQIVTRIIPLKNIPSTQAIPILRPLVPQYGHLAPIPGGGIIITDSYDNIQRISAIIEDMKVMANNENSSTQ